jgi:hypothetical protein
MRNETTILGLALALALMPGSVRAQATGQAPAAPTATQPATPAAAPSAPTAEVDAVLGEQKRADAEAAAAQARINSVDDETQKMLSDYRRALADAESFDAYAAQLGKQVESQEAELVEIQAQLAQVEDTSRSITPLMQNMVKTLGQFVELDAPFLKQERTKRVETLRQMMDRADVSISEKYRRILEAYQVELDYGRTLETYEGTQKGTVGGAEDVTRTLKFLRIGRLSLLYQTLDGKETGYWDDSKKAFVVDDSYAHAFKEGVAVALKVRAPEMIYAPVPAPVEAKL